MKQILMFWPSGPPILAHWAYGFYFKGPLVLQASCPQNFEISPVISSKFLSLCLFFLLVLWPSEFLVLGSFPPPWTSVSGIPSPQVTRSSKGWRGSQKDQARTTLLMISWSRAGSKNGSTQSSMNAAVSRIILLYAKPLTVVPEIFAHCTLFLSSLRSFNSTGNYKIHLLGYIPFFKI